MELICWIQSDRNVNDVEPLDHQTTRTFVSQG